MKTKNPVVQSHLFKLKFAIHFEIKVTESGGREERQRIHIVGSVSYSFVQNTADIQNIDKIQHKKKHDLENLIIAKTITFWKC